MDAKLFVDGPESARSLAVDLAQLLGGSVDGSWVIGQGFTLYVDVNDDADPARHWVRPDGFLRFTLLVEAYFSPSCPLEAGPSSSGRCSRICGNGESPPWQQASTRTLSLTLAGSRIRRSPGQHRPPPVLSSLRACHAPTSTSPPTSRPTGPSYPPVYDWLFLSWFPAVRHGRVAVRSLVRYDMTTTYTVTAGAV
jgi:hypothetical protein